MTTRFDENMLKFYPDVKVFFSNVQINGSLNERAKTVSQFLERGNEGERYFVIADKFNTYGSSSTMSTKNGYSKFHNNGVDFYIGELKDLKKVNEFKRKAVLAIDAAEIKGGLTTDKRKVFKQVFKENVNIIVGYELDFSVFSNSFYDLFYYSEVRDKTRYVAWL
jgi:hypothetical protein